MINREELESATNLTVESSEGTSIGAVQQIFLSDADELPTWVTVAPGSSAASARFVPLSDARLSGDVIVAAYDQQTVAGSPDLGAEASHLSPEAELQLQEYYGIGPTRAHSSGDERATVLEDSRDVDLREDTGLTRSEEQITIGTERHESRARLRKYVVTETVDATVPVTHEVARMVSEPISSEERERILAGGDQEVEGDDMILYEEEVVVTTRMVPVERVRIVVDVVQSEEGVTEQVRKEQIETEEVEPGTR